MTTAEAADQLIAMCREGKFVEAVEALYADDVVSVEAAGIGGMPRKRHPGASSAHINADCEAT